MLVPYACFDLVVGWVAYRTLIRKEGNVAISDLSTVVGVVWAEP